MADIVAVVAGIAALLLGVQCLRYRNRAKKTEKTLGTVIEKASQRLSEKAEEDMAEQIVVESRGARSALAALDKARDKIRSVMEQDPPMATADDDTMSGAPNQARSTTIPDDIREIAEASARRMRGEE